MNKPGRLPLPLPDDNDTRVVSAATRFVRVHATVAETPRLRPIGATATLFRSLHGRHDWGEARAKRWLHAAKYLARSLTLPRRHARFLAFVAANPLLHAYRERDPRLLERHFHRYVNSRWGRRQRLQCLQWHYRFAMERLPQAVIEAVYVRGGAEIGELRLKDGGVLRLGLCPPIIHGGEGELGIQIDDVAGRTLYRVMFSVADEGTTLVIGCLQGPAGEDAAEVVRALTRNLHGLRPKQLMLALACAFAGHYGIRRILAVGNATHPLRKARERFRADYDAFWSEQHGRECDGGWFELPVQMASKLESEVPSHHRAAFRRRQALRVEAERLLLTALAPVHAKSRTRRDGGVAGPCHPLSEACAQAS